MWLSLAWAVCQYTNCISGNKNGFQMSFFQTSNLMYINVDMKNTTFALCCDFTAHSVSAHCWFLFVTARCSWLSDLSSDSQLTATTEPNKDNEVTLRIFRNMESQRAQEYVTSTHEIGALYCTYFTNRYFRHILHVKYMWTFKLLSFFLVSVA